MRHLSRFTQWATAPLMLLCLLSGGWLYAQETVPFGNNNISDCSPKLVFTVEHSRCDANNGNISFSISDFGGRTNVAYSIDNGLSTVSRSTTEATYTFANLSAGNYQIYAIWGNGDCPTLYGSVQVYGRCDEACNDYPVVRVDRTSVGCDPASGALTFSVADFGSRETVRFSTDGGTTFTIHNLADGDFTVSGLATGSYALRADWGEADCTLDLGTLDLVENCVVIEPCEGPYVSKNGLVIMEVEATESPLDQWVLKTDVEGFTGTGHLEFTGNNQASGPPMSPLDYSFTITEGGLYRLTIKSRKRLEGQPSDRSNDGYVRLRGNFGESPNAGDTHNDDARLADLMRSVKFFGGNANGWGWAQQLDLGGETNKRQAVYDLRAGETYTFNLSGRSQNYNADKIVFFRLEDYSLGQAQTAAFAAGETCDNSVSTGSVDRTEALRMFPNPVDTMLNLEGTDHSEVTIYDLAGRKVLHFLQVRGGVDVSELKAGTYLLKVNGNTIGKFIKR